MTKKIIGVFVPTRDSALAEYSRLCSELKYTRATAHRLQVETDTSIYTVIVASNQSPSNWSGCQFSDVIINSCCDPVVIPKILVKLRLFL